MRKLNREQKRRIINAKKQNLLPEIERLYVDSYNEGVRDGSLTILLALRDRFGFGNERIKRVLEHCTIYMQGIHNHEINADEICETLKQEGIKMLCETDL